MVLALVSKTGVPPDTEYRRTTSAILEAFDDGVQVKLELPDAELSVYPI